MLFFKELTEENFSEVEIYFDYELEKQKRHKVRMSDRTPGSLYLWFKEYDVSYVTVGDSVIFHSRLEDGRYGYYYPIGKNKRAALRALSSHIKELGGTALICAVGEHSLSKISRELFITEANASRDLADYIYNKAEFENPTGKRHHKRKNLLNRFADEYPDARFVSLTPDNLVECYEYYKAYCESNPESSSVESSEYKCVSRLFESFNYKYFSGGMLYADNKIIGFTIAQIYGDTVYVHIEKAEKDIAGAYQTLNRAFLLTVDDKNVKYVNREEDMGLAGLRRSKMAYCPAWLEYKYMLVVESDADDIATF